MKQYYNVADVAIDYNALYRSYCILMFQGNKHALAKVIDDIKAYAGERKPDGTKEDAMLYYLLVKKENKDSVVSKLDNVSEVCSTSPDMKSRVFRLMVNSIGSKGAYCIVMNKIKREDKSIRYVVCLSASVWRENISSCMDNGGLLIKMDVKTYADIDDEYNKTDAEKDDTYNINSSSFMDLAFDRQGKYSYGHPWDSSRYPINAVDITGTSKAKILGDMLSMLLREYGEYLPVFEFRSLDVCRYKGKKGKSLPDLVRDYFNSNSGRLAIGGETDELKDKLCGMAEELGILSYEKIPDSSLMHGKCNLYGVEKDDESEVRASNKEMEEISQHIARTSILTDKKNKKVDKKAASNVFNVSLKELMIMDELSKNVISHPSGWRDGVIYEFFMPEKSSWDEKSKLYNGFSYMAVADGKILSREKHMDSRWLMKKDCITATCIGKRDQYSVRITEPHGNKTTVIIERTDKVAIPDLKRYRDEINKKNNSDSTMIKASELKECLQQVCADLCKEKPKDTEHCTAVFQMIEKFMPFYNPDDCIKWADIEKMIGKILEKEEIKEILSMCSFKRPTVKDRLYKSVIGSIDDGIERTSCVSQGETLINDMFPSALAVTYTDDYYIVSQYSKTYGINRNVHNWNMKRYDHLYKTTVYGDKGILDDIYGMLIALYIRNNMPTVLPFPFSYMKKENF